ncbi:transcription repressor OFP14-like [Actinidia eriantha]|uniref:transcription repressor OFP14-like n=1 Tax=Actinidia eriantha TaxID=165200 RepID=UPI00258A6D36|nr:transcription repressor OFP14-like [Actinidia eriantha]
MDSYKSYCERCNSTVINDMMESPRRAMYNSPSLALMMDPPKNLCESHWFLTSPHKSSLIAEEACRGTCLNTSPYDTIFAVAMHSSEPYVEFYTSMVEVVRSRLEQDLTVDWAYMSDLLGCYCEINDKRSHKYIVRAFMDVVEGLHQILS